MFFSIILFLYNDIIIIPNTFFKNVSKEYYFWYLDRPSYDNETKIVGITILLKILFSAIFLLEYVYLISDKSYVKLIGKKYILYKMIIVFTIYLICFFLIKYKAIHYKLYMSLFSTGILSLMLLNLGIKL